MPAPSPLPAFAPAPWQTAPFTTSEIEQVRRYCGYGAVAAFAYDAGGNELANLDLQCSQLTDAQMAVVRSFLTNISAMETALYGAGANLDTDAASVWTHNKNEVSDRTRLYKQTCRDLCAYLQIPPGPWLVSSNMVVRA